MADTQDLFVERLNPDDARLYEFEGEWRQAEVVREEIQVKGRGTPEALDVTVTHHGPIVSDALGASEPVALSWTGLQYPLLTDSGYRIGTARTGQDVIDAVESHHVPPLNLLWADRDGNIGYQLAGKIPLRKGNVPDLPKPGWTGEFEWEGTIPYDDLPRTVNPPQGFIVTANNRIVGDDYPHHITSEWMTGYRARRIEELLGERERHSLADFERMQHDFFSIPGSRDGAPALAPASGPPARGPGDRAPQELGREPRSRYGRRHDLPCVHDRVRRGGRARRGAATTRSWSAG